MYVFFPSRQRHSPIKKFCHKKYDLSFSSRFAHYDSASVVSFFVRRSKQLTSNGVSWAQRLACTALWVFKHRWVDINFLFVCFVWTSEQLFGFWLCCTNHCWFAHAHTVDWWVKSHHPIRFCIVTFLDNLPNLGHSAFASREIIFEWLFFLTDLSERVGPWKFCSSKFKDWEGPIALFGT